MAQRELHDIIGKNVPNVIDWGYNLSLSFPGINFKKKLVTSKFNRLEEPFQAICSTRDEDDVIGEQEPRNTDVTDLDSFLRLHYVFSNLHDVKSE